MVAAHQRRLRPGSEYAHHFQLSGLKRADLILADGDTFETIRQMDKWIRHYQHDTATLAPTLVGATLRATCQNDWNFAYQHFQYKLDKDGVEQLRRPLRSWADRKDGIDCDCYAILLSTILLNQGIPHKLRKTKYNGKPDYQHIYVIVPIPGSSKYITLDPVVDAFDKEVPYSGKFDHDMKIQGLDGVGNAPLTTRVAVRGAVPLPAGVLSGQSGGARLPFGLEFLPLQQALSGLGAVSTTADGPVPAATVAAVAAVLDATPAEAAAHVAQVQRIAANLLDGVRQNLVNTRRQVLASKETSLYDFADKIAAVLAVWDNAPERDALIAQFSSGRTYANMTSLGVPTAAPLTTLGALNGVFDSIGDFFGDVGHAVAQAGTWVGQQATTAAHAVGQAGAWVGTTVAAGAVAAWSGVKQATSWVGQQAATIGKLVLKYNPLSILIRLGLRVAMRVNLFYMSERLALGYASEQEAAAAGLDLGEFRKATDRLNTTISLYKGLQGDENELREAILAGNRNASHPARLPSLQGLGRPAGLGEPVTATTTAAASGFIATIVSWLKSVDWTKLFARVAAAAGTVKALVSKYFKTPQPAETAQMPLTEQEYYANQAKYDNPPVASSNAPLIIGGLALAGYLLFVH